MRIKLTIEYDGTAYAGWQRQENALAVQQVIEEALTKLTRARVVIAGASRTDAGVHALGQTAHFDTESRIPPDKYAFALNTMLPADIRIRKSEAVSEDFHAPLFQQGQAVSVSDLSKSPRRGPEPEHPRPRDASPGRRKNAPGTDGPHRNARFCRLCRQRFGGEVYGAHHLQRLSHPTGGRIGAAGGRQRISVQHGAHSSPAR